MTARKDECNPLLAQYLVQIASHFLAKAQRFACLVSSIRVVHVDCPLGGIDDNQLPVLVFARQSHTALCTHTAVCTKRSRDAAPKLTSRMQQHIKIVDHVEKLSLTALLLAVVLTGRRARSPRLLSVLAEVFTYCSMRRTRADRGPPSPQQEGTTWRNDSWRDVRTPHLIEEGHGKNHCATTGSCSRSWSRSRNYTPHTTPPQTKHACGLSVASECGACQDPYTHKTKATLRGLGWPAHCPPAPMTVPVASTRAVTEARTPRLTHTLARTDDDKHVFTFRNSASHVPLDKACRLDCRHNPGRRHLLTPTQRRHCRDNCRASLPQQP
jgi:hypothetical protein